MDKKYVIRFLKEGRRGAYTVLLTIYSEVITSVGPAMALQIIRDDLQKETDEEVVLNYSTLSHAIKKYKDKAKTKSKLESESKMDKWEFLDSHEITDKHLLPGKFKLPQGNAGKSTESKLKAK